MAIEDDPEARMALQSLLAGTEFELVQAVEGGEGLKAFYAERPDVVLLDLGLPNEEGWAVLASIRELSDAPVVAIAARDGEAARVRALRSGADDCVTEPIGGPLSRPPSNRSRAMTPTAVTVSVASRLTVALGFPHR